MSDLTDLYQEVILDHTKKPRNHRKMATPCQKAEGYNPLCGDRVTLYVNLEGDTLKDLSFEGSGCAISTASASLLTEILKGKTVEEVKNIFKSFHDLVTGSPSPSPWFDKLTTGSPIEGGGSNNIPEGGLGKLEVFSGVREFPMRVKCATLAWHTLKAALEDKKEPVSTEE